MTDLCRPEFFHGILNWQQEEGVLLRRLPKKTIQWYEEQSEAWGIRANCVPGVRLELLTDAQAIGFCLEITGQSRPFASFGLVIDGALQPAVERLPEELEQPVLLPLDGALHRVSVYLPHLVSFRLKKVWAEGETKAEPVNPPQKKYYAFGDSVTQGMTGSDPAGTYVSRLARGLNLDVTNFGVGGIRFLPETLEGMEGLPQPDLVTVALGTNDWAQGQTENMSSFLKGCAAYFKEIDRLYPQAAIFVLLPLWHREEGVSYKRGTLQNIRDNIARTAAFFPRMKVIDAKPMIPEEECFFADGLHPNNDGFALFGQALYEAIKPMWE